MTDAARFGHWYFIYWNLFRASILGFRISESLGNGLNIACSPKFQIAIFRDGTYETRC